MRDTFPNWYQSPLNSQSVIDLTVIDWLLEQIKQSSVQVGDYDWTARIYEGQNLCLHEYQYGLPPPDRIGVSYIRDLRAILEQLGVPLK